MAEDKQLSTSEARNLARQMRNTFRAFEHAAEVMETVNAAESHLAALKKATKTASAERDAAAGR